MFFEERFSFPTFHTVSKKGHLLSLYVSFPSPGTGWMTLSHHGGFPCHSLPYFLCSCLISHSSVHFISPRCVLFSYSVHHIWIKHTYNLVQKRVRSVGGLEWRGGRWQKKFSGFPTENQFFITDNEECLIVRANPTAQAVRLEHTPAATVDSGPNLLRRLHVFAFPSAHRREEDDRVWSIW